MKKYIMVLMIVGLIFSTTACSKKDTNTVEERARAVKVLKVEESKNPVTMQYIGTLNSKDMIGYSFKTNGKISRIYVEKGDKVSPGDKLAEVDLQDLNFQISAAKANLDTTNMNIRKAEESLKYTKDSHNKMNQLYTEGVISKDEFDKVELKLNVDEANYNQTKSQYEAAKVDYDYKLSLLDNAVIYAEQAGTVAQVRYQENERVGPSVPVVVVRGGEQIINIGIAQKDLNNIRIGSKAVIDVDGVKADGVVTNIAEAPDTSTRTYNAEIEVKDKQFRLGSIAKVGINIGEQKGVWVPIDIIFSNGEDYVYTIKDNRAFKRTVTLTDMSDDKVLVKGIKIGEFVATSGMKNLNDGSKVNIVK
ncbi:efflux RND transporter periplasmic adaptor subunit [Tepidibacter hydrothermalis]|uniref:Efflux RND transporter periplasmic adaptor subunit n=1 Tax=Tepidibacter hydrothermalis TaxID=3036126 RepID=A0ABY8E919_9FIRM|nr:efflux RND transporter periplasmic adaptor subunit [Tepidibacter hydrothermalis]WFD09407.1 efflux RND transporter periplasmic adaptor subunit [Tepidibacter hydrothermalis]